MSVQRLVRATECNSDALRYRRTVQNNNGVRQGCVSHPPTSLNRIMYDALEEHDRKVSIGGKTITNMRFADDTNAFAAKIHS